MSEIRLPRLATTSSRLLELAGQINELAGDDTIGLALQEISHELAEMSTLSIEALTPAEPCFASIEHDTAGEIVSVCHRLAGHAGEHADWSPDECIVADCACTDVEESV